TGFVVPPLEPAPPVASFVDTRPVRDVIIEVLAALAGKHAVTRYADLARALARCTPEEADPMVAELATLLDPISERLTHGRGEDAKDVSIGQFLARGVLYASKLPDFDAPAAIARLLAVLDARGAAPIAKLPLAIIAGTGSLAADAHRHLIGRGLEPRELWIRNRLDAEPTSLGILVEIRYYRRDKALGETALVASPPGLGADDLPRLFDVIARLTERSITPIVIAS
ncbi:MAG: hypothetical protein H0T79_23475, partial [Deltaproteobacteria bacterium]|nr:hypothetical protein [Deltaproteobacteria bacterium]